MSRPVRLLLVVVAIAVIVVTGLWFGRQPLGDVVVARWLAARQVPARYRIVAISPRTATLADVSLGPPAHPDFTAARIEARIGWAGLAAGLDGVTLVRPFVRATIRDGRISLGAIDRLIPPSPVPAVPLPSIDLRIVDAEVRVETAAGVVTGRGEGGGRLNRDFMLRGTIAPVALAGAGCTGAMAGATLVVRSERTATRVDADGRGRAIACAGVAIDRLAWAGHATLPPEIDRYSARLTASTERIGGGGVTAPSATIAVDGRADRLTGPVSGRVDAALVDARGFGGGARAVSGSARYGIDPAGGTGTIDAALVVSGARATLPNLAIPSARGTLVAPLLARVMDRARAAASGFAGSARIEASRRAGVVEARITGVTARSASGARLIQTGRIGVLGAPPTAVGRLTLDGGGLPSVTLDGDARWTGAARGHAVLTVAPYTVPGASLDTLRLDLRADGATMIAGDVRVSGPIGGGATASRLGGSLALRRDGRRTLVGTACTTLSWTALASGTSRSGPGGVRACPSGEAMLALAGDRIAGGIALAPLALRATVGGAPLGLTSGAARLTVAGTTAHPLVALAPVPLDATVGARRFRATVGGTIDAVALAGSGQIDAARLDDPGLPVAVTEAAGQWRVAGSRVSLANAGATITDRATPARFEPMRVTGGASLAARRIEAAGDVGLVATPARLLGFKAMHDLATARGSATIDTGALTFGPGLQPYQITEALRGVVAAVRGPVTGTGRFDWSADGITSRGTLAIGGVSLATAALGPVDTITGTLVFDDLLAMTTPPGQVLRIARINPGIAVDDGVAIVRLLGPDAIAIESIRWPYAGGTLTLAPVEIRAGDARRTFVLTVDGLDGERFLQKFEIKNVNVTGRFDGRLPLDFADGKGRISHGILVARSGGGLVQYVGDVGGDQLGAGARLAFDALRRLRYRDLALDLDGDLDGELVTNLRFTGTNETEATIGGGPLPIRATGLPFRFTVAVRAPFRALLGTAASFGDVRPLLRPTPVQPR